MTRPKILIADDDRFAAMLLMDCLAELDVQLLYARNGKSALRQTEEQIPDLILLDLAMPDLDGFEVARSLKQKPETRSIPIIFVTGDARVERRVTGFEIGAEDFITKPFHPPEVVARIKKVLRATARNRGFSGRLADLSLSSILQFLELEQKSGILELFTQRRRGLVYFEGGRVAGALLGPHAGEAAFYRLLGWAEGFFQFEVGEPLIPPKATITAGTQMLLLEGARRLDELRRLRETLPPATTRLVVSPRLQTLLQGRRPAPELQHIVDQFDGARTVGQVLEESEDDLRAAEVIARLLAKGILTPQTA